MVDEHNPDEATIDDWDAPETRRDVQRASGDFGFEAPTDFEHWFDSEATPYDDQAPLANVARNELARGTRVGEYEIEAKVSEGAMGTIYRAVHPTIGKRVAIKLIGPRVLDDPDSVRHFLKEARAVAALGHPGIVHVFGFGRLPDGRMYLTMEWLDGTSLAARLEHGELAFDAALDIVRQIARALEAAHAKLIVHRDLKPDNVFLQHVHDEPPIVKLLDFGLAKVGAGVDSIGKQGQIVGTPLYMSPEQCRGGDVDPRADIYALGCIAYELLAGQLPFPQRGPAQLIAAHLDEKPPRPRALRPTLPREVDDLLHRMLAKRPDDRPSLAVVRRTLGALGRATPASGVPIVPIAPIVERAGTQASTRRDTPSDAVAQTQARSEPPAPAPAPAPARPPRPRWQIAIAIAVGALAVIALGVVAFRQLAGAERKRVASADGELATKPPVWRDGVPSADVQRTVAESISTSCYRAAPPPRDRAIAIRLKVDVSGYIVNASVVDPKGLDPGLVNCLQSAGVNNLRVAPPPASIDFDLALPRGN